MTRQQPLAFDSEAAVLGAALLDQEVACTLIDQLQSTDFYLDGHRKIYSAIASLIGRGTVINIATVSREMRNLKTMDDKASKLLNEIVSTTLGAAGVEYHVEQVIEKATLRRLITVGSQITELGYKDSTLDDLLTVAEEKVFSLTRRRTSAKVQPIGEHVYSALDLVAERKGKKGITGLPTGYKRLDAATGGMQKGDLIILAARPSMGKSALATCISLNAGATPGLFVSLEMPKQQIIERMVSQAGRVNGQSIRLGVLDDAEWSRLGHAAMDVSGCPIYITDDANLSVYDIRSLARGVKNCGYVIVDYLQLIGSNRRENRNQALDDITRQFKQMAKELQCPVIVLSQLNRAVDERPNKRPMLSDLRDSGAIEQHADMVMFLYRDEYYNKGTDKPGVTEVIIAKQRMGPTCTVELKWLKDYTLFADPLEIVEGGAQDANTKRSRASATLNYQAGDTTRRSQADVKA